MRLLSVRICVQCGRKEEHAPLSTAPASTPQTLQAAGSVGSSGYQPPPHRHPRCRVHQPAR